MPEERETMEESEWMPIETAPTDGTWIIGRNADGVEARIQSRQIHPKVPELRHWAVGDEAKEGSWLVSKCFYPVEWRPEL